MDLERAIHGRHSVRKFTSRRPPWRKVLECIDAARYAPMAGNNYTMKFIVIDDPEKLSKIAEASQQRHVAEVGCIVVACSNPSRPSNMYGGKDGDKWANQQAGAAIQNFLLKVEELGMATCWVGYFVEEHVRKILGIPKGVEIVALFPLGYEDKSKRIKRDKINLTQILYFNSYGSKVMNPRRVMKED